MNLKKYLKNQFLTDFRTLNFEKPNQTIQEHPEAYRIDSDTVYFGGSDWKNIKNDIIRIDKNNLEFFFLCLFTVSIIDLTMFKYFGVKYGVFRNKTRYPKFGWSGFGPHYENPKKLLLIPLKEKIVDFSHINEHINEYVDLFIDECTDFFSKNTPEIETNDFISSMLNDRDLQLNPGDQNTIIEVIISNLKKRIV